MANRLADETSPYLLQHKDNPVDWYPWGEEALQRAQREDKPVLVSIGYSACHWCHVMERESLEDAGTAALMNESFVCIKVDREERPDVDAIYMEAVQAMTGHGGWPLNAFLTPAGVPFYAGTYYPPQPRHGMPSWRNVLEGIARAWDEQRDDIIDGSQQIVRRLQATAALEAPDAELDAARLDVAVSALKRGYDPDDGGWGGAPKFPQPMTIEFLLRLHLRSGDDRSLAGAQQGVQVGRARGLTRMQQIPALALECIPAQLAETGDREHIGGDPELLLQQLPRSHAFAQDGAAAQQARAHRAAAGGA